MILFASLLAAAQSGVLADWRPLHATEAMQLAWDAAAIARSEGTTTVRVRLTPLPARTGENAYAISHIELRCGVGTARVAWTVNYGSDGREGLLDISGAPFAPIQPDTLLARVRERACPPAAR